MRLRLPIPGNSESIAGMKPHGANRCLTAATVSFLMMLSVGAAGQEQEQPQEQGQPSAPAQRLFVSDKLVLNVYAEADQGSTRVATIETGEVVEALERTENFVRVRLNDGREGWVGTSYLTSDAPAAARLRDLQREQKTALQNVEKKSADEIARLKKETTDLQTQLRTLKGSAASGPDPSMASATSAPAESTPRPYEGNDAARAAAGPSNVRSLVLWAWSLAVVAAGGLGFLAGYQTLARRMRKKYGGLKIY